ncbi:tetratricopeptide repeat protein [Planctomycetota bacterium]
MTQENKAQAAKAQAFFERAEKAAERENFDYAIDMYLEGLRCAPDNLQEGHVPLRQLALHRKKKGAKKPSMVEIVKRKVGKSPLERMLNAEYLFAKDPENLSYWKAILKAAIEQELKNTVQWIADMIFQANIAAKRPSAKTYILLKDSYSAIGLFDRAIAACQRASKLKPGDGALADELQRLSAELAVARGKYDQAGDFRESIKDREAQEKLQSQDSVVKTESYRKSELEEAREAYSEDPERPKNIFRLVQALVDLQKDESDNEAIELLEKAYRTSSDFSFKENADEIKIKQMKRSIRNAKKAIESNPNDQQCKEHLSQLSERLNDVELEHYRLCAENYPTDLKFKYEYAVRLVRNKRYDDAIPLFQEAKREPRYKISAMSKIGLCFFLKDWFADAIDVFNQALDAYEKKDDSIAKELRYNLGRAYEGKGDSEKALEIFRKIAQLDFGYKDIRERVDKLRGSQNTN